MGKFKFTRYNEFTSDGIIHCSVSFIPAITLNCEPPFIKGKRDSCWIKFRPREAPKSKEELEDSLGMSIMEWE